MVCYIIKGKHGCYIQTDTHRHTGIYHVSTCTNISLTKWDKISQDIYTPHFSNWSYGHSWYFLPTAWVFFFVFLFFVFVDVSVGTHVPLHICGWKKTQRWDATSVSSSTIFETGSLVICCSVCQASWPISIQGLSWLCLLPFCRSAGAADAHKHIQAFVTSGTWGSSPHACIQFSFFPSIFKHLHQLLLFWNDQHIESFLQI